MGPLDPVQLDHERRIRRLEEARVSIEDTMLAMIELDRSGKDRHAIWQAHMEQNLAEMGDKLDGLIGWAEGSVKKKKLPKRRNGHKK